MSFYYGKTLDVEFAPIYIPIIMYKLNQTRISNKDICLMYSIVMIITLTFKSILKTNRPNIDIQNKYNYKNLKIARGLEKRYESIAGIIQFYGINYFKIRYNLNDSDLYEFILGAVENYDIENNFKNSNHGLVLEDFNKFYASINN